MSSEAMGWVIRHSPYKGVAYTVHTMLADSANDQHNYEIWMKQATMAGKSRCSRAQVNRVLDTMCADGMLMLLSEGKVHSPNHYRLLMPDTAAVTFNTRPAPKEVSTGVTPKSGLGVKPRDSQVSTGVTANKPKSEPKGLDQNLFGGDATSPSGPGGRTVTDSSPLSERPIEHQLAVAEWERRTTKPVCKFPALRARIKDALDAGYTPEQVAAVLPSMTVFSRNSFDLALGKAAAARPQGRPIDTGGGVSGPVAL